MKPSLFFVALACTLVSLVSGAPLPIPTNTHDGRSGRRRNSVGGGYRPNIDPRNLPPMTSPYPPPPPPEPGYRYVSGIPRQPGRYGPSTSQQPGRYGQQQSTQRSASRQDPNRSHRPSVEAEVDPMMRPRRASTFNHNDRAYYSRPGSPGPFPDLHRGGGRPRRDSFSSSGSDQSTDVSTIIPSPRGSPGPNRPRQYSSGSESSGSSDYSPPRTQTRSTGTNRPGTSSGRRVSFAPTETTDSSSGSSRSTTSSTNRPGTHRRDSSGSESSVTGTSAYSTANSRVSSASTERPYSPVTQTNRFPGRQPSTGSESSGGSRPSSAGSTGSATSERPPSPKLIEAAPLRPADSDSESVASGSSRTATSPPPAVPKCPSYPEDMNHPNVQHHYRQAEWAHCEEKRKRAQAQASGRRA